MKHCRPFGLVVAIGIGLLLIGQPWSVGDEKRAQPSRDKNANRAKDDRPEAREVAILKAKAAVALADAGLRRSLAKRERAEAQARLHRTELKRLESLFKSNAIEKSKLEEARVLLADSASRLKALNAEVAAFEAVLQSARANFGAAQKNQQSGNVRLTARDETRRRLERLERRVQNLEAQLKRGDRGNADERQKVRIEIRAAGKDVTDNDGSKGFIASVFWIEKPFNHELVLREMKAAETADVRVTHVLFEAERKMKKFWIQNLINRLMAAGFKDVKYHGLPDDHFE